MSYFSIVLSQIIGFVIYLLIGMVAVRMHVLDSRSLGVFSQFITKVSMPLLLFTNTLNGATTLPYNFTVYLRGYDNVTATLPAPLSALFTAAEPKPKPGTDVLLVQGPTGSGVPVTRNNSAAQLFVQQLSSKANYCGTGKQGYSDLCEGDIVMVSDCQKARIFQITQTQVVGGGSEVNIGHSNDNKYTPGNAVSSWGGASSPVEERFGAGSVLSRMETRVYYIARPSAGAPYALYRKSGLGAGMPLVDGVTDIQLTFGATYSL